MEIAILPLLVTVLVFALMFLLINKYVANPQTKNILLVVVVIIAIICLLNFLGIFGKSLIFHW